MLGLGLRKTGITGHSSGFHLLEDQAQQQSRFTLASTFERIGGQICFDIRFVVDW